MATIRNLKALLAPALLILVLTGAPVAPTLARGFSGSSSSASEPLQFAPEEIIRFAKKVERVMASKGARIAVLARMGRPLADLPPGMHFTHVAFAVYSEITTRDGRQVQGYAIHNLYQRESQPDVSDLVVDYPVDFFGGVAVLEAGVIIPSPELQDRLLHLVGTENYRALHDPHYSVIANPYTLGRQNCTEFVLDVLHSALNGTSDIKTIKALEKEDFVAQKVEVNPFKLMLGSMFSKEVSLSDQHGTPVTATFETISAFLSKVDKDSETMTIRPDE